MNKIRTNKKMTLLDFPVSTPGVITKIQVSRPYEERLHALDICIGSVIQKTAECRPGASILVQTTPHTEQSHIQVALSSRLAAHIFVEQNERESIDHE